MRHIVMLSLALGCVGSFVACNGKSPNPNVELIQDMMDSPAVKAQDDDDNSMRLPPDHTVPQGWTPYTIPTAEEAAQKLSNPFPKEMESVMKGQKLFLTYCFPCHGALGDGKGPVAEKWPSPIPNLHTRRVRDWKDGHIYHLITRGRGMMGSYAMQIRPDDRWHIINYVRDLESKSPVMNDDGSPVK